MLWATLLFSAFTSATFLPGTSDVAFTAFVAHYPEWQIMAWLTTSMANSLGSMVSYAMGKMLPEKSIKKIPVATLQRLQKYGATTLFLAWLPIVGDALPLAAGFLRLPIWQCALFIALGKFARYGALLCGVMWFQAA
ncbi:MAG: VTT domain-containing protein [Alysiella sp.]|uniref:YqaA family protein n=1 Tax=Alysiella sp. TaxID=1872483 RepID=UPI0026DC24EE|nr:VTT domain-containing protein [Alysiella sp.]MDO4434361.1 VTT domain-containing protein [Alysiella sp.]